MAAYMRVPLARSVTSARLAREMVRGWLVDVGRGTAEYAATQLVDELVTNAVLHAYEPISLHLWCQRDGVRIGVSDGSTDPPTSEPHGVIDLTGRGLELVDRLSTGWGTDVHEGGKLVWAEITPADSVVADAGSPVGAVDTRGQARWHRALGGSLTDG
jgi:anti-sigma regulatory factor (Ser/Thr protein kinase)